MTTLITLFYFVIGALVLWLILRWSNRNNSETERYVPDHYEPRKEPPVIEAQKEPPKKC